MTFHRELPVRLSALVLAASVSVAVGGGAFGQAVPPPAPASVIPAHAKGDILPLLEKCADAQLTKMGARVPADWTASTFYVGLAALSHTSQNPKYAKECVRIATTQEWKDHWGSNGGRKFFADDEAIGQLVLDVAATTHDKTLLEPMIKEQSELVEYFKNPDLNLQDGRRAKNEETLKMEPIAWWWCDSLFMEPAVLVRLSAETGDMKYIDAMCEQYWKTADLLYDKEEHLFYRDNRFIGEQSKNGKKVFWSRGDGWVMSGLCHMLTYMPKNYSQRAKFETLFKDMAAKLVTLQKPDGLWAPSLLDPEDPSFVETSGSAFFTYAFAWGVNNGLLDEATYGPAAKKGWDALVAHLRPDGELGFVQPIGFKPDGKTQITIDSTQYYGNGAFLMAGTELLKSGRTVEAAK